MRRKFLALIAVALLAPKAHAHSASAEVTAGGGYFGLSLLGELELVKDQTFLTGGYAGARPSPYSVFAHLLTVGVDHALPSGWLLAANLSGGPPAITPVTLGPELTYKSITSSLGANAVAAYGSGGFGFFEYGFDVGAGVTAHWLARALEGRFGTARRRSVVTVLKPQLGVTAILDLDTELSLRGGYWLYSEDPLKAGELSDAELDRLLAAATALAERRQFTEEQKQAALSHFSDRVGEASAVSGLPAAPLWFEVRFSAAHRFTRRVRGQLGYTFDRYVPTQGHAHVVSTRWTVRFGEALKLSFAAALQIDVLPPPDGEQPAKPLASGLLTAGAEYAF